MSEAAIVILAGGRATRFGGGDKCLAPLGKARVIDYVLDRLRRHHLPMAINANGDPRRFAEFRLPVLPDGQPGHPGPLAGVLAGMRWAAGLGLGQIVTVAADTPYFPHALVPTLIGESAGGTRIVIACCPNEDGNLLPQPTFGIWPVALADDLETSLLSGTRKIMRWVKSQPHAFTDFPMPEYFFNINSEQDRQVAEDMLKG